MKGLILIFPDTHVALYPSNVAVMVVESFAAILLYIEDDLPYGNVWVLELHGLLAFAMWTILFLVSHVSSKMCL